MALSILSLMRVELYLIIMSGGFRSPQSVSRKPPHLLQSDLLVPMLFFFVFWYSYSALFYCGGCLWRLPHSKRINCTSQYLVSTSSSKTSRSYKYLSHRAMLRDPEKYSNPHVFMPERFLRKDGTLNHEMAKDVELGFGFGRRYS